MVQRVKRLRYPTSEHQGVTHIAVSLARGVYEQTVPKGNPGKIKIDTNGNPSAWGVARICARVLRWQATASERRRLQLAETRFQEQVSACWCPSADPSSTSTYPSTRAGRKHQPGADVTAR